MKALQYYGKGNIKLEDIPEPSPGPDEVKINVAYAGICGTDYEEYLYGPLWIPEEPHPVTGYGLSKGPVVLGHELSGIVSGAGKNVTHVKEGDRVASYPIIYCGECDNCKRGDYYLCSNIACLGLHCNGGFEEQVVVPGKNVFILPDGLDLQDAAAAEPLGFSLNSGQCAGITIGDDVAVFGAGIIGLLYLQVARVRGARRVIMIARRKNRLDTALKLGADAVIDTDSENVTERIMELTGGKGVDIVMEATGSNKVVEQIFPIVRSGGRIALGGVFPGKAEVDLKQIVNAGRTIVGLVAHNPIHFQTALKMLADGRINVKPIITKAVDLENIIPEGFNDYLENKGKYVKLVAKI